jgi:hypothetical protein
MYISKWKLKNRELLNKIKDKRIWTFINSWFNPIYKLTINNQYRMRAKIFKIKKLVKFIKVSKWW